MPTKPKPRRGTYRKEHAALYGRWWQRVAAGFLRAHSVCVGCGRVATEVDHIIPHHGKPELFYDAGNWQSLCKRCHTAKTRRGE